MKTCREFQRWRKKNLKGGMAPEDAGKFEKHLLECPKCSRAFQMEKTTAQFLKQASGLKAPDDFNQRVWDRIRSAEQATESRRARFPQWGWVAAGLAGVVIFTALYALWQGGRFSEPVIQQAQKPAKDTSEAAQVNPLPQPAPVAPKFPAEKNAPEMAAAHPRPEPGLKAAPARQISPVASFRADAPKPMRHELQTPVLPRRESSGPSARVEAEVPVRQAAAILPGEAALTATLLPLGTMRLRPNKFNPTRGERVILEMNLEKNGPVEAKIYSREGLLVKTLHEGDAGAGYTAWSWNGANDQGLTVASGIYILLVRNRDQEQKFKLAVIR